MKLIHKLKLIDWERLNKSTKERNDNAYAKIH